MVATAFPPLPALATAAEFLHTSEAVTEGQLDKLCDVVCDDILQACLELDEHARVSLTAVIKSRMVFVAGEIAIKGTLDYDILVRNTLEKAGYVDEEKTGMDFRSVNVVIAISEQSPDLASALSLYYGGGKADESICIPHGDFGSATGYATDESPDLMPVSWKLATRLARELSACRADGRLAWLKPNGKVQVTLVYKKNQDGSVAPVRIYRVCVHNSGLDAAVSLPQMQEDIRRKVVDVVLGVRTKGVVSCSSSAATSDQPTEAAGKEGGAKSPVREEEVKATEFTPLVTDDVVLHLNFSSHKSNRTFISTNSDEYQGTGASGQKTSGDLYGGWVSCPSRSIAGRDPYRVERFATYAARWIAKSLVASKLCRRAAVTLHYASNFAEPASIEIDTFGTASAACKGKSLVPIVQRNFDLRVGGVVRALNLPKQNFRVYSCFGHLGGSSSPWEEVRKLEVA